MVVHWKVEDDARRAMAVECARCNLATYWSTQEFAAVSKERGEGEEES